MKKLILLLALASCGKAKISEGRGQATIFTSNDGHRTVDCKSMECDENFYILYVDGGGRLFVTKQLRMIYEEF